MQDLEEKKLDKNDIVFEKDADGDLVELGKGSMGTVYSGQYIIQIGEGKQQKTMNINIAD